MCDYNEQGTHPLDSKVLQGGVTPYCIMVSASPDPADNYLVGPFKSEEECVAYIDACLDMGCDDFEYALVRNLNTPDRDVLEPHTV